MKKVALLVAVAAFTFASTANAQEKPKAEMKKECSAKEKKTCDKEHKGGCCAAKKAEKKD